MLIDDKFIYCSIPRTGTVSFHISCLRNGIDIKHVNSSYDFDNQLKQNPYLSLDLDNNTLSTVLDHVHECVVPVQGKFGTNFEIVAVRRNKYERFISSWKHLIKNVLNSKVEGYKKIAETLSRLDENEIFDFDNTILTNKNAGYVGADYELSVFFLNKFNIKIPASREHFLNRTFWWPFMPTSFYHQHINNVIWFDFEKLYELESWVSNKLSINFKLERVNSSQGIECNLKLTDNFIKKYNTIYDRFDSVKTNISFI